MNYSVTYNGRKSDVFRERVCTPPYNEFTYMEYVNVNYAPGETMKITSEKEISSVTIRPKSKKYTYNYDLHTITLEVEEAFNFVIEINSTSDDAIAVFVNRNRPAIPENMKVLRFLKSEYVGYKKITQDNIAIVIDEGVNITGKIEICNSKNVLICGCGSINATPFIKCEEDDIFSRCVKLVNCTDVKVFDITVLDSRNWSLSCHNCENVLIDNVKIISSRGNADGIDICGSRKVRVSNCFTRVWDDSLVVKGFDTGDVYDIRFSDCVLWNDFARPIEIGVELRAEKVYNIEFSNIDVIHSMTGYPIMGIHHGDRARVSDVVFKNIRIEDAPGAQIFDVRITDSKWNQDSVKGNISNITFENIYCTADKEFPSENSRLEGYDEKSKIRNVKIKNIFINGKCAASLDSLGIDIYNFVENISFEYDCKKEDILVPIEAKLFLEKALLNKKGSYDTTIKIILKNNSKHRKTVKAGLLFSPINMVETEKQKIEIAAEGTAEIIQNFDLQPGKYAVRVSSDEFIKTHHPLYIDLPWCIEDEYKSQLQFVNFYGEKYDGIFMKYTESGICLTGIPIRFFDTDVYTVKKYPQEEGNVVFSCEETDFGMAPALVKMQEEYITAPQLRCPAEITYVFKNYPKVEKITKNSQPRGKDLFKLTFEQMGLKKGEKEFFIEIVLNDPRLPKRRYPLSLFHSQQPEKLVHMFAEVKPSEKNS